MNAKKIFKAAFGAVRAGNKGATTLGGEIVGITDEGVPAACCGFSYCAYQDVCIEVGSNNQDFKEFSAEVEARTGCIVGAWSALELAAHAAVSCFAWRLYHAEHPATSAPARLAARRAADAAADEGYEYV